jgi:hypothetical protein
VADPSRSDLADAPARPETVDDGPRGFPWPPVLLLLAVTLVSIVAVGVRSFGGESDGPKVLNDAAFIATATTACAEAFPPLRPQATDRDDVVGAKEIAVQARAAAGGLEALATRLRALPVDRADAPFVATWLDEWTTFIDAGRRYATVLDTGDVRAANRVATTGDAAQQRADRFARANGLKECQLRAVFVAPPRRSAI